MLRFQHRFLSTLLCFFFFFPTLSQVAFPIFCSVLVSVNTTSCVLSQISEPSLGAAALPIAQPQQQHPRVLFWVSPFLHAHQKSSHGQTARPIALQDVEVNDEVQQESLRVGSRWVFSCLFDTCLIGSKSKSQILDKTSLSCLRRGCQERELVPTAAKSTCSLSHPEPTPPWANLSLFQLFPFSIAGIWQNLSSPG